MGTICDYKSTLPFPVVELLIITMGYSESSCAGQTSQSIGVGVQIARSKCDDSFRYI